MFVDDIGIELAKREGLIEPLPHESSPLAIAGIRSARSAEKKKGCGNHAPEKGEIVSICWGAADIYLIG
jgi:hypothetical protein